MTKETFLMLMMTDLTFITLMKVIRPAFHQTHEGYPTFVMIQMKGRIYHHHQCDEDDFAIRMMMKLIFVVKMTKRSLLSYSVYHVTHVLR